MKRSGGLGERFEGWLLGNLPPLSGRLRFVFYGGSLVLFFVLNDGLSFDVPPGGEPLPMLDLEPSVVQGAGAF